MVPDFYLDCPKCGRKDTVRVNQCYDVYIVGNVLVSKAKAACVECGCIWEAEH